MKHYQIVVKGIVTNKIDLIETTNYKAYKDAFNQIKKECEFIQIITTNIYED